MLVCRKFEYFPAICKTQLNDLGLKEKRREGEGKEV